MSPQLLCDHLHHWDVRDPPSSLMCIQLVKYSCALKGKTPGTLMERRAALTGSDMLCFWDTFQCHYSTKPHRLPLPIFYTSVQHKLKFVRGPDRLATLTLYLASISRIGSQFPAWHKQEIKQEVANSTQQSPNTRNSSFQCSLVIKVCRLLWVYLCGQCCSAWGDVVLCPCMGTS